MQGGGNRERDHGREREHHPCILVQALGGEERKDAKEQRRKEEYKGWGDESGPNWTILSPYVLLSPVSPYLRQPRVRPYRASPMAFVGWRFSCYPLSHDNCIEWSAGPPKRPARASVFRGGGGVEASAARKACAFVYPGARDPSVHDRERDGIFRFFRFNLEPREVEYHWQRLLMHQSRFPSPEGRKVDLRTAAFDYFLNETDLLAEPMVMERAGAAANRAHGLLRLFDRAPELLRLFRGARNQDRSGPGEEV